MASHIPYLHSSGNYAVSIGYSLSTKGKRVQKKHWLGKDQKTANATARTLETAWDNETATHDGQKVWSDANLQSAKPTKTTSTPAPKDILAPSTPVSNTPKSQYNILTALDEYFTHYKGRLGEVRPITIRGQENRITSIQANFVSVKVRGKHLTEITMDAFDNECLQAVRKMVLSRPLTRHPHKKNKPISLSCVRDWMVSLCGAFKWFKKTKRIGWRPEDTEWNEYFALQKGVKNNIKLEDGSDDDEKPAAKIIHLLEIFRKATPRGKLYTLMGLLLGQAQEGIASLQRRMIYKDKGEWYIDRKRGKTGEFGFWWIAPELAEMLNRQMARTPVDPALNPAGLAFLTEDGNKLARDGDIDTIRNLWDTCTYRCPKSPDYSFGQVKKCGIQLVFNVGGEQLAQLFAAHKPKTIVKKHYAKNNTDITEGLELNLSPELMKDEWDQLHDVQRKVWSELKPLFYPAKVQNEGKAA